MAAAFATRPATLATPNGTATNWTLPVNLPVQGDWDVTAFAVDTAGQQDTSTSGATARYRIYPGDTPPALTENLLAPTEGTAFPDGRIFVSGRAEDDQAMQRVEVGIVDSQGRYMSSGGTFTSTNAELADGVPDQPRHRRGPTSPTRRPSCRRAPTRCGCEAWTSTTRPPTRRPSATSP